MKKILATAATILAISSSAWAQPNPELAMFEAKLKSLYPNTQFGSVVSTPIQGVYEVQMGGNIAYVGANGRHFMFGKLYDMQTQTDLTDQRMADLNRVDINTLPLKDAIKTVKGNGKRTLVVFSDPDCPFCKKLEASIKDVKDVTIYTFLMPLTSIHPDSKRKAVSIWCSSNPSDAWQGYMTTGQLRSNDASCENPIDRNVQLGNKLNITGTPTMFTIDGRKHSGASEAVTINSWLDNAKPIVQASSK